MEHVSLDSLDTPGTRPGKPAQIAEYRLMEAILSGACPAGQPLPAERILADNLGVTRPTLREALQRLSREGWVTIRHGKSTLVNDYLTQGGLGVLGSIARHTRAVSHEMVCHLLEVRAALFPGIAGLAVNRAPDVLAAYLEKAQDLSDAPGAVAAYDWGLQMLMVHVTGNPVFRMIINDFSPLYRILGETYFGYGKALAHSRAYYRELLQALPNGRAGVENLVHRTLEATIDLWKQGREQE
ncbi:MAG: GntR family transcriptional regulator [Pseudomonadota bacterium]